LFREYKDLSYREIVDILHCLLGTVMSHLGRASVKLGAARSCSPVEDNHFALNSDAGKANADLQLFMHGKEIICIVRNRFFRRVFLRYENTDRFNQCPRSSESTSLSGRHS
jgi:hypothetical protein